MKEKPAITIDVGPLLDEQWTGIPVFTKRLVQALIRHGGVQLGFCSGRWALPSDGVLNALAAGTGTSLRDAMTHRRTKCDRSSRMLFPTAKKHCGLVPHEASVVHDMSTLFMPETHEAANVAYHTDDLRRELASDEIVFCTSEATRAALCNAFPSVSAKTRVLYQFVDWPEEFESWDRNLPPLDFGRYAVVVGTIEPRKNLSLILDALSLRPLARSKMKFVIIGRKGWLVDELLDGLTAAQREHLVFTGFISEFTKYRLLKNAEFLVYPSLYEGFGIPALEAMSLGKPVLASRTSSFPEVIGDAGVFFDPLSAEEFADAFDEIRNPRRLKHLAPKALAQAGRFGWRQMSAPIIEWACS